MAVNGVVVEGLESEGMRLAVGVCGLATAIEVWTFRLATKRGNDNQRERGTHEATRTYPRMPVRSYGPFRIVLQRGNEAINTPTRLTERGEAMARMVEYLPDRNPGRAREAMLTGGIVRLVDMTRSTVNG
jgi:hypothetical protein